MKGVCKIHLPVFVFPSFSAATSKFATMSYQISDEDHEVPPAAEPPLPDVVEDESAPDTAAALDENGQDDDARAPPPDPETATADDLVDEETRESYANILATQRFVAMSEEDQRILRLQQAEIADLLERSEELGKNEYFNVSYFTSETRKVWQQREMDDRSTSNADRPNAVRLFPNAEAAEHQRALFQKLREDHSLEDREELKRRHPLLFNRVVRDEARREVFKSAMEARRQFNNTMQTQSALPLLLLQQQQQSGSNNSGALGATSTSCASSILNARKAPFTNGKGFQHLPEYIRGHVQQSASQCGQSPAGSTAGEQAKSEWVADVEERMIAANQIVDGVAPSLPPPKAPTLKEMLASQQKQLQDLATSEETTYKPLLESYFRYDAMVRGKLDKLAEDLGIGAPNPSDMGPPDVMSVEISAL